MKKKLLPNLGIGIGFRMPHYEEICTSQPTIDWFEIISENFMVDGGKPIECLEKLLEKYTIVQHGVSLAIRSPIRFRILKKIKSAKSYLVLAQYPYDLPRYREDVLNAPNRLYVSLKENRFPLLRIL